MISKLPDEAPKIVKPEVLEFMDNATKNDIVQNKRLAQTKPVEFKLDMELKIHKKLGNRVQPDQMMADPRAIMDDLWDGEDQYLKGIVK